jgi:hypothetical protein
VKIEVEADYVLNCHYYYIFVLFDFQKSMEEGMDQVQVVVVEDFP